MRVVRKDRGTRRVVRQANKSNSNINVNSGGRGRPPHMSKSNSKGNSRSLHFAVAFAPAPVGMTAFGGRRSQGPFDFAQGKFWRCATAKRIPPFGRNDKGLVCDS